jgi:hypothetical protein
MPSITIDAARAAKAHAKQRLAGVPGMVGLGLTRQGDGYALKVNLQAPVKTALPKEVDGVPLVFEVVGTIKPL